MRYLRVMVVVWLFLSCFAWVVPSVRAECRYKFTPSLSVDEKYDDNIFLRSTDETSDWTSTISPALSLDAQCPTRGITLNYSPGFVFYKRYTEYNTVRHNGNLSAFLQAGPHTRIDFRDSFYRTEEPREQMEAMLVGWRGLVHRDEFGQPIVLRYEYDLPVFDVDIVPEISYAIRRTRNTYYRNTGDIKVSHQFGPKDNFFVGYNDNHLENSDPEIEDTRIQTPFAGVSYWFDVKNGLDLNVRHSISDYETNPDFKQYTGGARLVHLFSQDSSISLAYNYTDMNYDPGGTDYVIHDGMVSYSISPGPHTTLSAGVGYFLRNPERGGTNDGLSYQASIGQKFERGSVFVGGQGGYRQELSDAENLGFAKFWSANGGINYLLLPELTASGGLSYVEEKFIEQADRRDKLWSATAGLAYSYRRWLSLSLSGQHTERDSNVGLNDYDDNQIMLRITASYN
ncbi:MAG: outer membrane beta-barrel protein [Thermodesulfobacteriota bacterium]|nr:outer membrane beta-barrel protein [Thermodesulfobacteriota bacterium]